MSAPRCGLIIYDEDSDNITQHGRLFTLILTLPHKDIQDCIGIGDHVIEDYQTVHIDSDEDGVHLTFEVRA